MCGNTGRLLMNKWGVGLDKLIFLFSVYTPRGFCRFLQCVSASHVSKKRGLQKGTPQYNYVDNTYASYIFYNYKRCRFQFRRLKRQLKPFMSAYTGKMSLKKPPFDIFFNLLFVIFFMRKFVLVNTYTCMLFLL